MSAHTPGPWEYDAESEAVFVVDVDSKHDRDIAQVFTSHEDGRLIARAPELLAEIDTVTVTVRQLRAELDAANAENARLREALVDLLEKWKRDVRAGRGPTLGMADRINAALAESEGKR